MYNLMFWYTYMWQNSHHDQLLKDRGAWCAAVHEVAKSWIWLSSWVTTTNHLTYLAFSFLFFPSVGRTLKIYSLSTFQVYNILIVLLTRVMFLYINQLSWITEILYPWPKFPHYPLYRSILSASTSLIIFNFTCISKWDHAIFVFLCLAYFT